LAATRKEVILPFERAVSSGNAGFEREYPASAQYRRTSAMSDFGMTAQPASPARPPGGGDQDRGNGEDIEMTKHDLRSIGHVAGACRLLTASCVLAALGAPVTTASAQTYGFATLQPGTLNHTTASAAAKVLKEKAGLNVLVQPTAGDNVIIPMVGRGEAEIGISNIMEVQEGLDRGQKELRLIAAAHALRTPYFVRKDSTMRTIADLRGKRVTMGYSAMRALDPVARAMLATANLTEKDIVPVLVPNVVRSADDFAAGAADMFFFAFGAPKVREVDVTVGGIRVLEIDEKGMPAARKIMPWGYLTQVTPGPIFIGVEKPMSVYSFDNVIFTSAKVKDELVYKILDTLENNKPDLVAIQPVLREFSAANGYKKYGVPYHPAALKYFTERKLEPKTLE
jgi:TRAP transporter TAXI family solute receptor